MFDIRHKNVSRRECFWIAVAYMAVILGLILVAFFFTSPHIVRQSDVGDPTGGASLPPATRWAFTAPPKAVVLKDFFACPLRSDLIFGASLLIKNPESPDSEAVNDYLTGHSCVVLHPPLRIYVREVLRQTRCVQIPGDNFSGCYWAPESILEVSP